MLNQTRVRKRRKRNNVIALFHARSGIGRRPFTYWPVSSEKRSRKTVRPFSVISIQLVRPRGYTGGVRWLRYDELYRQRKAVRPSLRWDHKDIGLWMKLMTQARVGSQPFHEGAGGALASSSSAGKWKGFCWDNEGTCKFGGVMLLLT